MEFAGFDSNDASLFAPRAPVTIGHFNGTVIDQDSKIVKTVLDGKCSRTFKFQKNRACYQQQLWLPQRSCF